MKLYRYSPIKTYEELGMAIGHVHAACHELCRTYLGEYLPVAGNIGIFTHYEDEYNVLTAMLVEELADPADNFNNKYFKLHKPIVIPAAHNLPETKYTHLYIRKPDIYRSQVGDVDFLVEPDRYESLKKGQAGKAVFKGMRSFGRSDLDMIEVFDPDVDVVSYLTTTTITEKIKNQKK